MDPAPDILTQPPLQQQQQQQAAHGYSRSHSLTSVSPALNHALSMEATRPAHTADPAISAASAALAAKAAAAAAAATIASQTSPAIDAYMHNQFAHDFHAQLQNIDSQTDNSRQSTRMLVASWL